MRVRVAHRFGVESFETGASQLRIGAGPRCGLRLRSGGVGAAELRLAVRRGRLLAAATPGARVGVGWRGHRLEAPVVLSDDDVLELGPLRLRARAMPPEELGPVEVWGAPARSRPERAPAEGVRRYALDPERDGVWSTRAVRREAWAGRIGGASSVHLSQVESWIAWRGRPGLVERFPAGIGLGRALLAPGVGAGAPRAARVLILAHLARALEARGPHGHLRRDAVHLGFEGRAVLLAPPPPGGTETPDAVSLARLGIEDLGLADAPEVARRLAVGAGAGGRAGPPTAGDLFSAAYLDGIDPSRAVLARWARVAAGALPPPVVGISAVDGPGGAWDSVRP